MLENQTPEEPQEKIVLPKEALKKRPKQKSYKDEVLKLLEQHTKKEAKALTMVSEVPGTTLDKPYQLPEDKDKKSAFFPGHPAFYIINSPLVGLLSNPDKEKNLFRNSLRILEAIKAPYCLIAGNLTNIDLTKASKNQGYRALLSDDNGNGSDSIFELMNERITKRIKQANDSMTDENGKQLYSGPKLLSFAKTETEIVNYWVSEEARRVVLEQQRILNDGIKRTKDAIGEEKKFIKNCRTEMANWAALIGNKKNLEESGLTKEEVRENIKMTSEEIKSAEAEKNRLEQEFKFLKDTRAAATQTNLSQSIKKKWYINFYSKLVRMFEENIPNLKVISTGDVYLKSSNLVAHLVQNPRDADSDIDMDKRWVQVNNALHNGERQPDVIFVGGFNLTFERYDCVYPARDPNDPRKTTIVDVVQLPMCIDSEYLKKHFEHTVNIGPFITRLIKNPYFAPALLIYGNISGFPVWDVANYTTLTDSKLCADKEALRNLVKGRSLAYGEFHSDQQEGSRYQAFYDIKELPGRPPPYVLHHNAFVEWNAPLSFQANIGDIVQGENFDKYHLEDPEGFLHAFDVEEKIREILARPVRGREDLIRQRDELARLFMENSAEIGVTRIDKKLESYHMRAYERGSKYYGSIIKRAEKIGLATIGKLGIISKIGGNHFENTKIVGYHFDEAKECSKALIEVLSRKEGMNADDLRNRIKAPRGSGENVSILAGGLGMLNQKDYAKWVKDPKSVSHEKFLYCISAKHKPTEGGSRKVNPVVAMRRARALKGSTDPIYQDRFIIQLAGHINRNSQVLTPNGLCQLVPCDGEFQTPFAEIKDFGLGDIGAIVMGLPMHGRGFFRTINFSYEGFRSHIKNGGIKNVDVKALFRNAL